ncbi:MAG: D-alanyl-D-alanine carboxypeptidase family protein [Acidimicrobiia bacterium]
MKRAARPLALLCALASLSLGSVAAPLPAAGVPVMPIRPVEGLAIDPPPELGAITWILYDETYNLVLASEGADIERPMASTTKVMTGIIALENSDPDQTVLVSERAAEIGEAAVGLVVGESLELGPLTTGLLVRSGNDAAIALAEGVSGTVEAFVEQMNDKAAELGLEHTRFANPHGLDEPGHYSTASDLLEMTRAAMDIPEFAGAVAAKVYRFPPEPDGSSRVVENTNLMLWSYEGTIGGKTGFTFDAGLVLSVVAERDGRRLYAVVMGSEGENAHFEDASALLDYGFESFGVVPLIIEGTSYGLLRSGDEEAPLLAAGTVEAFVHIAAAGVLAPELALVEGDPVLVVGEEEESQVAVVTGDQAPLPDTGDALNWFQRWLGGER